MESILKLDDLVALIGSDEYKKGKLVISDSIFCDCDDENFGQNIWLDHVKFENVKFINCDFFYTDFGNCTFKNCLFENTSFGQIFVCKFNNCTFDGFFISHNNSFYKCQYYNLKTTKRQQMAACNVYPTFASTDLSGQENYLMSGNMVRIEHYNFVNSQIDLATIRRMAIDCEFLQFRSSGDPQECCKSKIGKDIFSEPSTYFAAQDASIETKMNFIMAIFAHDIQFEIDNSDMSLDFLPIRVTSSLKKEPIKIVDEMGKEVDLTKIVPFNFDLTWDTKRAVPYPYCDLSTYNEMFSKNGEKE